MIVRRAAHLPLCLALSVCTFIMVRPPMRPCASHCVFIAYAHRDGADLAQRLQKDLATKFDAWLDTQRLSVGDIWSSETEQAIDRADVVLALLSAGSFTSDICRAEQGRALDKGKCVLPRIRQGGHTTCKRPTRFSPESQGSTAEAASCQRL